MDNSKWSLSLGATVKDEEILPELKIKDQIDENQKLQVTVSKDKIYGEYELKF